ncbi:hypothetical protein HYC85_010676 [Camellia sinensis]|uniref:Acyl carrier protein n=1 Tax=Camellia sinensis TaxID=4442 RepID=A0A7J7HIJ6_CAMSI|nr:hypothetical protein HYC85_010676 [Camellia sinensis]
MLATSSCHSLHLQASPKTKLSLRIRLRPRKNEEAAGAKSSTLNEQVSDLTQDEGDEVSKMLSLRRAHLTRLSPRRASTRLYKRPTSSSRPRSHLGRDLAFKNLGSAHFRLSSSFLGPNHLGRDRVFWDSPWPTSREGRLRSPFDSTSSATDYKVVRIVSFKLQTRVEVCSAISDCWRQIQVMDLCFYIHKLSCEVIVNGASYWLLSTASNHCLCFTWFDVQHEAFVMLLGLDFSGLDFSGFYEGTSVHWKLMDWNDNADVVVCGSGNPYVDVWMIDDCCGGESNWCDVTPDVHFQNDLGLDSFDNVEIVLALEEKFELEIPNKETNKIDSCFLAIEMRNFEVKITLKKMKSNKVLGPDGIPIEAWKYLDDIVLVDETREEVNTKLET